MSSPSPLSPLALNANSGLEEITELPDEDSLDEAPPPKPVQQSSAVNLDGVDWFLTTLLVTVDALLLELHRTGETKWATLLTWVADVNCDSGWPCKLAETMFVLAVAVVNVILLVPIVNINIRTPSVNSWRFWLMSAWASLCLLNIMMALQLTDSVMKRMDNDGVEYWVSHFFLVGMVVVSTLMLDVRFVMLYGIFTCLTCDEPATLELWNGLRAVGGRQKRQERTHLRDILNIRRIVDRAMYATERPSWHDDRSSTFKFVKDARAGVERFIRRRRLQNMRHLLSHRVTDQITDMPSEEVARYLDQIMQSKTFFYLNILRQKCLAWWDSISEEPGFFEYSSWMKAAVSFTILLLIYNCIKAIEVIFALDAAWEVGQNAAQSLDTALDSMDDVNDSMQRSLDEISQLSEQADVSGTVNATFGYVGGNATALSDALAHFIPEGATSSSSYETAAAMMHLVLIRTNTVINSTDFDGKKVISAFFYADSLIRWLKYACFVGYPIGTFVGLYSLFNVMKQHKDMSMGLAREEHIRSKYVMKKQGEKRLEIKEGLMGLEKKYPIAGAVYFIGVLASTAVVQQHIFGAFITLVISIFLNMDKFDVLLDFGGYIVLIYLVIIAANFFCSHIIGDRLLTQQGFKIRRPWLFFLFLFVFTIIHAVLGFFYALWRALLLFVTTVWVLNRLDISLFQAGKKLDHGHYSFMSMLLLTHIIRLENEARAREADGPLRGASNSLSSSVSARTTS